MKRTRALVVSLYAASGAAALIYEISWTRLLTLTMGHTVAAASAVLAAFMAGLAAGSWLGGLVESRVAASGRANPNRLRIYAGLELLIGVSAVLLPVILAGAVPILAWAYQDGSSALRFTVMRVLLCVIALGVPTAAMGATFPIAAAWLTEASEIKLNGRTSQAKRRKAAGLEHNNNASPAGILYAANSAGAAAGAIAAGLWLIPAIGVRGTTWIGVALNVIAAIGALILAGRTLDSDTVPPAASDPRAIDNPARRRDQAIGQPIVACAAAATSGFVALIYEVAWTRLVTLVIGPTTYAFTIVVASFIVGITLGSAIGSRLARRVFAPTGWLSATLAMTAASACAAGWFAATRLPFVVASQVTKPDAAFDRIVMDQAVAIAALLLPMTLALGAAFPLSLAVASIDRLHVGRDVARVYASNTLGAITGALVAGFALLPEFGLFNTFRVAAVTGFVASAAVWYSRARSSSRRLSPLVAAGATIGSLVAVAALPQWDLSLLASGAYKYAPLLGGEDLATEYRAWRLLSYKDGAAATVTVRELAGMRSLVIDGKVDASNMGDMLTQRLLGLLPVLLHPDPQDVCVIGLGSGVTASSALGRGTVKRADVVEISPEVVAASSFFSRENGNVLRAPNVKLIVGDGRSHLRLSNRMYDVIVSEPSNPWMAGIAALFTQEFFQESRARLKPDGLMCQWAHTYDMTPADLRSIVRTFTSVFPEATMWLVGDSDLLLIGSNGAAIDLQAFGRHCRESTVPELLRDVAIEPDEAPFALLSMLAGRSRELARYGLESTIQRDDRMALEFSAPRAIYSPTASENATDIRELASSARADSTVRPAFDRATSKSWTAAGAMELKADAFGLAYEHYERAVRLDTQNAAALSGLIDAANGARRQADAVALLRGIQAAESANVPVRVELSRLLAASGNTEQAAIVAADAVKLAPSDPRAGEQLASVFADAGNGQQLAPLADALVSKFPGRDKPRYFRANALFLNGRTQEAIDEARKIVERNPADVQAQNLLGVACATSGRRDCALAAFNAALTADARDSTTYVNLGVFHLQAGNAAAAIDNFSIALTLDRTSEAASQGLAEARAALLQSR